MSPSVFFQIQCAELILAPSFLQSDQFASIYGNLISTDVPVELIADSPPAAAAVEYRLLPNPFPAALQDAATVYCDLVLRKGIEPERIVIIGDSAGGNVALALARWIREEQRIGRAGGMILLSVRWLCLMLI